MPASARPDRWTSTVAESSGRPTSTAWKTGRSSLLLKSYSTCRSNWRTTPTPPASLSTCTAPRGASAAVSRSEEHTSELQSRGHLVCRLLLEKKDYEKDTRGSYISRPYRYRRHFCEAL